jgi:hypothetical protein
MVGAVVRSTWVVAQVRRLCMWNRAGHWAESADHVVSEAEMSRR